MLGSKQRSSRKHQKTRQSSLTNILQHIIKGQGSARIYITLQIKNPTQYDVTLKLYGEVNITGSDASAPSSGISGNHVLHNTVDFSVAKYSQDDYQIPLYTSSWWYADSNAVFATINDYHISELWRVIGNPP
jgi:hypothetical protein